MISIGLRAALLGLLLIAPVQERSPGADPNRETFLTSGVELNEHRAVTLRYRTMAWSPDALARMRREPATREQMNQRFGLVLQSELSTPIALSLQGQRLEAGSLRIGLFVDEAGAFQLTVQIGGDVRRFAFDLSESRQSFPYLSFTLVPAEEGLFALVFQWGTEYGRAVFEAAR